MKKLQVRVILLAAAALVLLGLSCSLSGSAQDDAIAQTQLALKVEQTVIARDKIALTEAAQSAVQPTADQPPDQPPPDQPPADTPEPAPADTPEPVDPVFTASETMFCRSGPSVDFLDHWMVYEGQSYPVFAKWHLNDWLVVEMDDPGTRTKCCWIGGEGALNVPLTSIQEIDYLPNRMNCGKPNQDIDVWDFNTEKWLTLSCAQIAQSIWHLCIGKAENGIYCTDVNYDNQVDYLVYKPSVDIGCSIDDSLFKP